MSSSEALRYLELKSGYADNGPAWIAYVRTSRSAQTVYFNGHALQKAERGRYRDVETGQVYWVSGIKKDGQDRHWAGSGKVHIEKRAVQEYMDLVGLEKLESSKYTLIEAFVETDIAKFQKLLNQCSSEDEADSDAV